MTKFKTLFMMQLKEKIDLSFLKSKKQTLFKIVFSILGFALITAFAYLVLWLCQLLNIFSAINHIPLSVMAVVLFVMLVLNFFTCTVGLSKVLFYSKDNMMLITLPTPADSLFLSKMLVYYINEIKKTFTFLIPVFLAYGILSGIGIAYFFWMPIWMIVLAAIPVLLGGLFAIPTNYILRFLQAHPMIKVGALVILLALTIWGVVYLIGLIPEDINLIESWTTVSQWMNNFLSSFTTNLFPFYALTLFFCGRYENGSSIVFTEYSWMVALALIGIIGVLILLNFLISRPLYYRIISRQFEFNKKEIKHPKTNHARHPFWATCVYEMRRLLRDSSILSGCLTMLIVTPIAVLFLNSVYAAINTRMLGDYFTMAFNVFVILLFVLAGNIYMSNIFSRDGEALYLNKTKPNSPFKILFPRLFLSVITTFVTVLISTIIFTTSSGISTFNSVCIFILLFSVALVHIVWSAEFDFMHPQNVRFATEGSGAISPNETKSTILTFALSALSFGIVLFFLIDNGGFVWLKLALASVAFLVYRIWVFYYKTKILFKEK